MDKCKLCGIPITPTQAITFDGFHDAQEAEVYEALKVINSKPAMRVVKAAVLMLILAASAQARDYHAEARRLAKISHKKARVDVIAKALRAVDLNAKALPPGFDRRDMIALALTESALYHREINRQCVGELGLYQVRPEYFRPGDDGLQVSINTALAVRVLRTKHATAKRLVAKRHSPYSIKKTTIIAYNGFVRRKGGIVDDRYYRAWKRNRARVDSVLGASAAVCSNTAPKKPQIAVNYCKFPAKPTVAQMSEAKYLEEMSPS